VDIRHTFTLLAEGGSMRDNGQVVYRDWNLVADAARVTQSSRLLKEINRFTPNDCNAIASFWELLVKLQNQYKDFLSDFKIWNQNYTQDWLIFPENLGKRLSIDETALSNGELYTILTNKAAKGRKEQ
jgi:hypothetical protein